MDPDTKDVRLKWRAAIKLAYSEQSHAVEHRKKWGFSTDHVSTDAIYYSNLTALSAVLADEHGKLQLAEDIKNESLERLVANSRGGLHGEGAYASFLMIVEATSQSCHLPRYSIHGWTRQLIRDTAALEHWLDEPARYTPEIKSARRAWRYHVAIARVKEFLLAAGPTGQAAYDWIKDYAYPFVRLLECAGSDFEMVARIVQPCFRYNRGEGREFNTKHLVGPDDGKRSMPPEMAPVFELLAERLDITFPYTQLFSVARWGLEFARVALKHLDYNPGKMERDEDGYAIEAMSLFRGPASIAAERDSPLWCANESVDAADAWRHVAETLRYYSISLADGADRLNNFHFTSKWRPSPRLVAACDFPFYRIYEESKALVLNPYNLAVMREGQNEYDTRCARIRFELNSADENNSGHAFARGVAGIVIDFLWPRWDSYTRTKQNWRADEIRVTSFSSTSIAAKSNDPEARWVIDGDVSRLPAHRSPQIGIRNYSDHGWWSPRFRLDETN
jgi:hypothetical protein